MMNEGECNMCMVGTYGNKLGSNAIVFDLSIVGYHMQYFVYYLFTCVCIFVFLMDFQLNVYFFNVSMFYRYIFIFVNNMLFGHLVTIH